MLSYTPAGVELDALVHSRVFFSKDKKLPCYSADWSEAAEEIEPQLTRLGCQITINKAKPLRERRVVIRHISSGKISVATGDTAALALCRAAVQLSYKVPLQNPAPYPLKRIASF
jgi:hypothetical protein